MNSEKEQALRQTLQDIQKRLGARALSVAHTADQTTYIATGFPDLDLALGGGLPRGRLTEILGKPTSGATTLTLKTMAQAQQAGDVVVYVDLSATFDPDSASRSEVKVADMLMVRPTAPTQALDMIFDMVASGLPGMVVLTPASSFTPTERTQLASVLRRLHPALTRSRCVLLLVSQPHLAVEALTRIAAVRLLVERNHWLYEGREVSGYQATVTLLKHKSPTANRSVSITVHTSPVGDGT